MKKNQYKKFCSEIIFTGTSFLKKKAIIISTENKIIDIINCSKNDKILDGIICPGFINSHCHLELSYLKKHFYKIKDFKKFIYKIKSINRTQNLSYNDLLLIKKIDDKMYKNGINVCADIVNTEITRKIKQKSKIHYINFIEIFGLNNKLVNEKISNFYNLKRFFKHSYLTLHAPYSVCHLLLEKALKHASKNNIFSIHFLESNIENELFIEFQKFNLQKWEINNFTSSYSYQFIKKFPLNNNILLVHNTFLNYELYIDILKKFSNVYFVICPNSNLKLTKSLPPNFLLKNTERLCIGTDSILTNTSSLSIINEINTILNYYGNQIKLETLLRAATYNGAKALKVDNYYGSIELGKKPGLILLLKTSNGFTPKRLV